MQDVNCVAEYQSNIYSNSRKLLAKYASSWEKRSRVRNYCLPDEFCYDVDKPDFLEEFIPFHKSESYKKLTESEIQSLLSYGWLAYNGKTIAIETKIISPICYDMIDGHIPGVDDNEYRKLIAETLTDESYHTLLSHYAMSITEKKRNISRNIFTEFDLINQIKSLESQYSENWQKKLIRLSVAIVSEIFISDYLRMLANCDQIISVNKEITKCHYMDETIHGKIFTELSKLIYTKLSWKEKKFLETILHYPVKYFASKELSIWKSILEHVCPHLSSEILSAASEMECFDLNTVDYSRLISLAEEMGMKTFSHQLLELSNG